MKVYVLASISVNYENLLDDISYVESVHSSREGAYNRLKARCMEDGEITTRLSNPPKAEGEHIYRVPTQYLSTTHYDEWQILEHELED